MLRRLRSFKRGTAGSLGQLAEKLQALNLGGLKKNSATRPILNHMQAAWIRFPDDMIILQL